MTVTRNLTNLPHSSFDPSKLKPTRRYSRAVWILNQNFSTLTTISPSLIFASCYIIQDISQPWQHPVLRSSPPVHFWRLRQLTFAQMCSTRSQTTDVSILSADGNQWRAQRALRRWDLRKHPLHPTRAVAPTERWLDKSHRDCADTHPSVQAKLVPSTAYGGSSDDCFCSSTSSDPEWLHNRAPFLRTKLGSGWLMFKTQPDHKKSDAGGKMLTRDI